jgi:hypothetical protein
MLVRLALKSDKDALRKLGKKHAAEITPELEWSEARASATFKRYLETASPTIFVAEEAGEVIGYVTGYFRDYAFTTGFSIVLDVIFVRLDRRGTRAAAELITYFNRWADSLHPHEITASPSNRAIKPSMKRFLRRFGFAPSGEVLARAPGG